LGQHIPTKHTNFCCSGISAALDAEFPIDGLLFLHQSAPYVMASNPFVLRWKDHSCSQWAIDTDANGEVPDDQHVVCSPPCWLLRIVPQFAAADATPLQ
jgi:hypothetical protein